MAIFKDDWGEELVKKELFAIHKAINKTRRRRLGASWKARIKLSHKLSRFLEELRHKYHQLRLAQCNWLLWSENPEYQIAIADMINGLAETCLFGKEK
jgi:hypothetical protein